MSTKHEYKIDALVFDTELNKVGYVKGHEGPYVQLRPPGGGREWDAKPEALRPATGEERLSCAVAVANERSRGGRLA